jgi:type VI secretion system protein ImpA
METMAWHQPGGDFRSVQSFALVLSLTNPILFMINVDDLLKPVADDKPCGEDFSYHPTFQNLETISRGKAKTQFDSEDAPDWQEPDWPEVQQAATEVLTQSKHLTAAVILALSSLKLGGLEGLRDGLALLRGLCEKYWPDLYPKLDPEDNNDPTERLNILNNLSSGGEPYKFTMHLKQLVLCDSPAMGRVTLEQVLAAKDKAKGEGGADAATPAGPTLGQIQAAFRDTGPDPAKAAFGFVSEAMENSRALESFLDSALGAGKGVNFENLSKLLAEIKQTVEPFAADGAPAPEAAAEAPAVAGGARAVRGAAMASGSIRTRADVIKALDLICDYYRDNEPSSPVPLILQRAQRLVDKDFMTIMTDLTPDALAQLQVITGAKPKEVSE